MEWLIDEFSLHPDDRSYVGSVVAYSAPRQRPGAHWPTRTLVHTGRGFWPKADIRSCNANVLTLSRRVHD